MKAFICASVLLCLASVSHAKDIKGQFSCDWEDGVLTNKCKPAVAGPNNMAELCPGISEEDLNKFVACASSSDKACGKPAGCVKWDTSTLPSELQQPMQDLWPFENKAMCVPDDMDLDCDMARCFGKVVSDMALAIIQCPAIKKNQTVCLEYRATTEGLEPAALETATKYKASLVKLNQHAKCDAQGKSCDWSGSGDVQTCQAAADGNNDRASLCPNVEEKRAMVAKACLESQDPTCNTPAGCEKAPELLKPMMKCQPKEVDCDLAKCVANVMADADNAGKMCKAQRTRTACVGYKASTTIQDEIVQGMFDELYKEVGCEGSEPYSGAAAPASFVGLTVAAALALWQ